MSAERCEDCEFEGFEFWIVADTEETGTSAFKNGKAGAKCCFRRVSAEKVRIQFYKLILKRLTTFCSNSTPWISKSRVILEEECKEQLPWLSKP